MKRQDLIWGGLALAGAYFAVTRARRGDDIAGEVAIVTGGSRGLGYLISEKLLREGCRVVICARDVETLERARERLARDTGGDVAAVPCDVGDTAAVDELVRRTLELHGRVDILVNNASNIQVGPLDTLDFDDFRKAVEVNYLGAVRTTLAVLPHMRDRGSGRIVNITSIGGKVAVPHLLPYDGAKFAAVGFSEGLRAELAGTGVSVTTVVPGLMRTGSPVHVEFRGQPEKEYVWFTLASLLPLTTMSAERAAERIVLALRRREIEVVLTWQASVLRLAHALAPALTTSVLGGVARMLPEQGPDGHARGTGLRGALPEPAERALERLADRTNQTPG